ncbi:MAG: hypothetical protein KAR20_12030, partial [Candidatus Heimdallarchaeota archaeon]|nr:hypothetical protein [Candidatus Heimdallarchaeota archaeon]
VASRQYQHLKIKELNKDEISSEAYTREYNKIVDKSCICVGLGTSALLVNDLNTKVEGKGVSVCPGPNMAYFSKSMSLREITDHIYGRTNVITRSDRPNMFIKELSIYIDYLKNKIAEIRDVLNKKQEKYLFTFVNNLKEGVNYYESLFNASKNVVEDAKSLILNELNASRQTLQLIQVEIENLIASKNVVGSGV